MTHHRHYSNLMAAVDTVGRTPCMDCPEVFFPEDFPDKGTREYAIRLARALCDGCPIKDACFMYATENDERYGVWAGTLPAER
jgi:hypothetical protein